MIPPLRLIETECLEYVNMGDAIYLILNLRDLDCNLLPFSRYFEDCLMFVFASHIHLSTSSSHLIHWCLRLATRQERLEIAPIS